jgi:cytoskeletal protein CcmA (bactofilin family)
MNFTAFGRGFDLNGSASNSNGTSHHNNGHGPGYNGNGNGHTNGNGNGEVNGHGPAHTNGHLNGNGSEFNGSRNGNGHDKVGSRFKPIYASLSSGVSIKGIVKCRSELLIDGEVEGTIQSLGRLTVGRNGHVRGDIQTRSVTVHGTVDGNLSVGEKCELRSGCTLRGDIETPRLVVEEDVNFTGNAAIATRDLLSELRPVSQNGAGNGSNNGNGQDHT